MTFRINIECPTAEEAIAELMHAATFYQKNPLFAAQLTGDSPAERVKKVKAKVKEEEAPPVDPTPAASPAVTASETTASAPVEVPSASPVSPVVTITEVRAFLTPFMEDAKARKKVMSLVSEVGGTPRLPDVPPENLVKLLAAAKELFSPENLAKWLTEEEA